MVDCGTALKRAERGAMTQAALELLDGVRAAQRLHRQRAEVANALRCAQDYLFNRMRVDSLSLYRDARAGAAGGGCGFRNLAPAAGGAKRC